MNKNIKHIPCNPNLDGMYRTVQHVNYSERYPEDVMTLILPWNIDSDEYKKELRPALVFVQGSGWTTPDLDFELPQMVQYAQKGFVVAMVSHRSILDGNPFPAYLCDVKTAIRYLRKNAGKYFIDPERVVIWGTSSGGNAALLTGLTGDDPAYKTEEYSEYSDAVTAVVSCFGPTDMFAEEELIKQKIQSRDYSELVNSLYEHGKDQHVEQRAMSPIFRIQEGKRYPSFLLLHGDQDDVVDIGQFERMYDRLFENNIEVEGYVVDGAAHEAIFWSQEVYDIIAEFLLRF